MSSDVDFMVIFIYNNGQLKVLCLLFLGNFFQNFDQILSLNQLKLLRIMSSVKFVLGIEVFWCGLIVIWSRKRVDSVVCGLYNMRWNSWCWSLISLHLICTLCGSWITLVWLCKLSSVFQRDEKKKRRN